MDFAHKTIIITGASRGIGRALAIKLAQEQANLVLAARNKSDLIKTVTECQKIGAEAIAVATDITQQLACQKLIDASLEAFGKIDCLINNAGITMQSRFDAIADLSLFSKIMEVNYLGSVYCTHYALPSLKESGGLVVAISSLTGKTGVPTRTGYAASKHAMQGFFDSLRIELSNTGVDVLVVSPGFVATDIRRLAAGTPAKTTNSTDIKNERQKIMSPEQCAALIIKAMKNRQRELVMTFRGKLGLWLKLLAPNLVDAIALKAISSQKSNS